jgi:hypothetical protein
MKMQKQKGYGEIELVALFFYLIIVVAAILGWILNIIKLVDSDFAHLTGMIVMRCIGVVMAPLGVVLGYL